MEGVNPFLTGSAAVQVPGGPELAGAGRFLLCSAAMKPNAACLSALGLLLLAGCASPGDRTVERGPDGTVAYEITVESSEAGARVEVNDDFVGRTPLAVRVWGDPDGTFHNFGTSDFVIRVFPVREGQSPQSKLFRTGGWFSQEDRIPKRLYFDLDLKAQGGFTVEPGKPRY